MDSVSQTFACVKIGREQRDIKATGGSKWDLLGIILGNYPPALIKLELVSCAKNVAESITWSQVKEALCL